MKYRIEEILTYNQKNVVIKTEYVIQKKRWFGWRDVKLPLITQLTDWSEKGVNGEKIKRGRGFSYDTIKSYPSLSAAQSIINRFLFFEDFYLSNQIYPAVIKDGFKNDSKVKDKPNLQENYKLVYCLKPYEYMTVERDANLSENTYMVFHNSKELKEYLNETTTYIEKNVVMWYV